MSPAVVARLQAGAPPQQAHRPEHERGQHRGGRQAGARQERGGRARTVPDDACERARREQCDTRYQVEHAEGRAALLGTRCVGDQRREQPLRESHVQSPEHDADERGLHASCLPRERDRRRSAAPRRRRSRTSGWRGPRASRPDRRRPRRRRSSARARAARTTPTGRRPETLRIRERLAEAREREQCRDDARAPSRRRRACAERAAASAAVRGTSVGRLRDEQDQHRRRRQRAGSTASQNTVRNDPPVRLIVAIASSGPANAPTVSSICRRPKLAPRSCARREVREQRVARRAADAFADPVREARADDPAHARREREQRFRERREPVAEHDELLALAEPVTQHAREHLRDRRGRLGEPFEQADRRDARAEHAHEEHGKSAWIISEERSISRLTKPSAQTPRGIALKAARGGESDCVVTFAPRRGVPLESATQRTRRPAMADNLVFYHNPMSRGRIVHGCRNEALRAATRVQARERLNGERCRRRRARADSGGRRPGRRRSAGRRCRDARR